MPHTPPPGQTDKARTLRFGLTLIGAAVTLVPALFMLEAVIPSRENSALDELPQLLTGMGITGLAVAGVLTVAYALLASRRHTRKESVPRAQLDGPSIDDSLSTMLASRHAQEREAPPLAVTPLP